MKQFQPLQLLQEGRAKVVGAQQADVSNTNAFLLLLDEGKCKQSNVLSYILVSPPATLIEGIQTIPSRQCLSAAGRQFLNVLAAQSQ